MHKANQLVTTFASEAGGCPSLLYLTPPTPKSTTANPLRRLRPKFGLPALLG